MLWKREKIDAFVGCAGRKEKAMSFSKIGQLISNQKIRSDTQPEVTGRGWYQVRFYLTTIRIIPSSIFAQNVSLI